MYFPQLEYLYYNLIMLRVYGRHPIIRKYLIYSLKQYPLDRYTGTIDQYFLLIHYLMPGLDRRQESLSRRDFHSFSPLVAATRGENE